MSGGRRGREEGVRRNQELTKAAFSVAFLWGSDLRRYHCILLPSAGMHFTSFDSNAIYQDSDFTCNVFGLIVIMLHRHRENRSKHQD
jgi:hypothetical protein